MYIFIVASSWDECEWFQLLGELLCRFQLKKEVVCGSVSIIIIIRLTPPHAVRGAVVDLHGKPQLTAEAATLHARGAEPEGSGVTHWCDQLFRHWKAVWSRPPALRFTGPDAGLTCWTNKMVQVIFELRLNQSNHSDWDWFNPFCFSSVKLSDVFNLSGFHLLTVNRFSDRFCPRLVF